MNYTVSRVWFALQLTKKITLIHFMPTSATHKGGNVPEEYNILAFDRKIQLLRVLTVFKYTHSHVVYYFINTKYFNHLKK